MQPTTLSLIIVGAVSCCSCASPSAPTSDEPTLYELRVTESPICPTLTAFPQGTARYGFFRFGTVTAHVKGSFSRGTFLLVDDNLATFVAECGGGSRPMLQLANSTAAIGSVTGTLDGTWFPGGCPGSYVGAQGTLTGTRDAASASGLLDGKLSNGIWALNSAGFCPAADHAWSLRPAQ